MLQVEKRLSAQFGSDQRFAFEERNGVLVRQYAASYTRAYDTLLRGMVERRMRQSIYAVASFWYTAWVNAGQPDLKNLSGKTFTEEDLKEFENLDLQWKKMADKNKTHE